MNSSNGHEFENDINQDKEYTVHEHCISELENDSNENVEYLQNGYMEQEHKNDSNHDKEYTEHEHTELQSGSNKEKNCFESAEENNLIHENEYNYVEQEFDSHCVYELQKTQLDYHDYSAYTLFEQILTELDYTNYLHQCFRIYKETRFKERTSQIVKIKSIINMLLRNFIKLKSLTTDNAEKYKILRAIMINFGNRRIDSVRKCGKSKNKKTKKDCSGRMIIQKQDLNFLYLAERRKSNKK